MQKPPQQAVDRCRVTSGFGDAPEPPATPLERLGDAALLEDPGVLSGVDLVLAVQGPERRPLGLALLQASASLPPLVHPAATISTTASVGSGAVVSAGVIVQSDTRIGRFCQLNTVCSIDQDNIVGDFVSVSPGARTAGHVTIEGAAFLGLGAVIINGVVVGSGATVGAGAVVTRNVPPGVTVVGNPARILKSKQDG